ncbi:MAG: alanine racemase, partial [Pseudomonadota bacterium]
TDIRPQAPLQEDGTPAGSYLRIDPAAVARNYRTLAARSGGECGGVVKANAYGLGIEPVARALWAAGCKSYFVALPAEGLLLRKILPGATIYVLNGLFDDVGFGKAHNLIPFLSCLDAVSAWGDAPFALNVDTSMNRLGVKPSDVAAIDRTPVLVASHFACADTPDHPKNALQEAQFREVVTALPDVPASLANSAALLTRPHSHYQLTRPGIALYGGEAAVGVPPFEPTVSLTARVIQVRDVPAGETIGYGAAETVQRQSRVAIVSAGYADGYLRASGGRDGVAGAPAFVNGVHTHLLGRVSMDLLAVDVTDAPCLRGDSVELIGPNVRVDDVARRAGTIGYELLTSISRRAERSYGPL